MGGYRPGRSVKRVATEMRENSAAETRESLTGNRKGTRLESRRCSSEIRKPKQIETSSYFADVVAQTDMALQ